MRDDHGAVSGLRCPHLRQVLFLCSFSAGFNCSFHVTVKQKSSAKHSCGSQQLDKGFLNFSAVNYQKRVKHAGMLLPAAARRH